MDRILLRMVSLALLIGADGVLAWQQADRYRAPYYSGQYYHGDARLRRAEQADGYRMGVEQRPAIRIEKASDAEGYLLRVHTRGMRPGDITVSTVRGRIRLQTAMLAWRNGRNARASMHGRFSRTLPLPADADPAGMHTRIQADLLEIRIPRR